MRIVNRGNKNTKSIAYTSLVRPILEYGAACWDPYRKCHINALDRVQKKKLPNFLKAREAQAGNPWRSVGRLDGYVRFTKRITGKGRGRILRTDYRCQTMVDSASNRNEYQESLKKNRETWG
jgi:hypothetical protein